MLCERFLLLHFKSGKISVIIFLGPLLMELHFLFMNESCHIAGVATLRNFTTHQNLLFVAYLQYICIVILIYVHTYKYKGLKGCVDVHKTFYIKVQGPVFTFNLIFFKLQQQNIEQLFRCIVCILTYLYCQACIHTLKN